MRAINLGKDEDFHASLDLDWPMTRKAEKKKSKKKERMDVDSIMILNKVKETKSKITLFVEACDHDKHTHAFV